MVRILIYLTLSAIVIIDIKKLYIPNILNILLFFLAIIFKGIELQNIEGSIIGMGTYTLPFIFIYGYLSDFLKKDVLGFGDVKLLLSLGYILGYSSLIDIYLFFLLTFVFGGVFGICYVILKKTTKAQIPFTPFIVLTFFIFESGIME